MAVPVILRDNVAEKPEPCCFCGRITYYVTAMPSPKWPPWLRFGCCLGCSLDHEPQDVVEAVIAGVDKTPA